MKTPIKFMLTIALVLFTTALISWDHSNYPPKEWSTFLWSYPHDTNSLTFTKAEDETFNVNDWEFSPEFAEGHPAAEDVLIQKIPGDNSHLLMTAYFSKENYSGQFMTIENDGLKLVFRDDGKGDDKQAGDGFYTAKIIADVLEFRQKALSMSAEMKKNGYKPLRFEDRAIIVDPDAEESFDVQKMDRNETVSISGLTNALSSDLSVTAAATGTLGNIRTHSIFITNVNVVEDPTHTWNPCTQTGNIDGAWTFNTIMRQLASSSPSRIATDAQVSDFVKTWLNRWSVDHIINGDDVKARTLVKSKILTPWLNKSRNGGAPVGELDMKFAPFKLLAIVNRFDLRNVFPRSPAGEGRLIFGLISSDCRDALKMTVILEYGINKSNTCASRRAWAQLWYNLKDLTVGSSQYNQALQNITDQFTLCGTNPSKINQSSLDQLRTNERELSSDGIGEMREFILTKSTGQLKENTVGQNPGDQYNAQVNNADVQRLAAFVNQNQTNVINETFTIPLTWQTFPFLGGTAHITAPPTGQPPNVFHWDGREDVQSGPGFIKNSEARFHFSVNTCWGCHAGETQTGFTHVDAVFYGREATLSGFLTGRAGNGGAVDFDNDPKNDIITVKDPALRPTPNPTIRTFNDILRRAQDLKSAAETACGSVLSISSELMFKPVNSAD